MNIGGTNGLGGPQRIYPGAARATQSGAAGAKPGASDRVEISEAARLSDAISRVPDIRTDMVARAKQMIADGTLDTSENLDVALDRLLDDYLGA